MRLEVRPSCRINIGRRGRGGAHGGWPFFLVMAKSEEGVALSLSSNYVRLQRRARSPADRQSRSVAENESSTNPDQSVNFCCDAMRRRNTSSSEEELVRGGTGSLPVPWCCRRTTRVPRIDLDLGRWKDNTSVVDTSTGEPDAPPGGCCTSIPHAHSSLVHPRARAFCRHRWAGRAAQPSPSQPSPVQPPCRYSRAIACGVRR